MARTFEINYKSQFQTNGVQALLMGGQACVFYGAAQVSKDMDMLLLAHAMAGP